jgi:hypothetical protein
MVMAPAATTQRNGDARRGMPPGWSWVAAAAAVLLVVALVRLAMADAPEEEAVAGDRAEPTSGQPQDDRVRVSRAALLGMDSKQAKERLEHRGFKVEETKRQATSPDQQKDTVAGVRPHGLVQPGASITLVVWEEYKPPELQIDGGDDDSEEDSGDDESEGDDPGKQGDDDPGKGEKGPSDKGENHGKPKGNE